MQTEAGDLVEQQVFLLIRTRSPVGEHRDKTVIAAHSSIGSAELAEDFLVQLQSTGCLIKRPVLPGQMHSEMPFCSLFDCDWWFIDFLLPSSPEVCPI